MSEAPMPAARWEDLIAHNQSQMLRFLGEIGNGLAGAWAAAGVLRLFVCLTPGGLAIFAASLVVEYFVGKAVDYAADKLGEALEEPGEMGIKMGSNNVSINRRPAARGGPEGDPLKCHEGKKVIEGSEWVSINTKPASRVGDWTNDSGKISTGSANVFIGGPKCEADRQSEWQTFAGYVFLAVDIADIKTLGEFGEFVAADAGNRVLDAGWDFVKGN
jgi:uncharacterized Zn-binding protein involved in type VI secretion